MDRYTVTLGAGWRLYAPVLPTGAEAIGVIHRGRGDTGALVLTPAGLYAQANAGALRSLDQRAADSARFVAALAAAGLSQRAAAARLGLTLRTISRYATGANRVPQTVWLALRAIRRR